MPADLFFNGAVVRENSLRPDLMRPIVRPGGIEKSISCKKNILQNI